MCMHICVYICMYTYIHMQGGAGAVRGGCRPGQGQGGWRHAPAERGRAGPRGGLDDIMLYYMI